MKRTVFYGFVMALGLGLAVFAPLGSQALAEGHSVTQAEIDTAMDCPSAPRPTERLVCACVAGADRGSIWGSGPYTGDSSTCNAAAHAGALEAGVGMVVVLPQGPQSSYEGSTQNGVTTSNWGSYSTSFTVFAAQIETATAETMTFSDVELSNANACPVTLPVDAESLLCACPAEASTRSIWGTGTYTGDSDICTAGLHAGVISTEGGVVFVRAADGQGSYEGSDANGVTSRDWRSYGSSITLAAVAMDNGQQMSSLSACGTLPADADSHSCFCATEGMKLRSIWGSSPYTADSDICTAALHAGAISERGGDVTLIRVEGLESYAASDYNGVQSSRWGSYSSSFVFDHNAHEE